MPDSTEKSKNPIPPWHKPAVDIPVQALREFVAQYGPNVAVLFTWTAEKRQQQLITVGSSAVYANYAVALRNNMADLLQIPDMKPVEDLRDDHPNVSLNRDQTAFLLWMLGYIYAGIDSMDHGHREYVKRYHDILSSIIGDAHEKLTNRPE